jgi:hypothetical protein
MDFEEFAALVNHLQITMRLGWKFTYLWSKATRDPEFHKVWPARLPCLKCSKTFEGEEFTKFFYSVDDFWEWLREPMD